MKKKKKKKISKFAFSYRIKEFFKLGKSINPIDN